MSELAFIYGFGFWLSLPVSCTYLSFLNYKKPQSRRSIRFDVVGYSIFLSVVWPVCALVVFFYIITVPFILLGKLIYKVTVK